MDPKELILAYEAGPAQLRRAVAGMSPAQITARPIAGKWSTLEVVCHLADFEPVYVDRLKRIITHENPLLLGADEKLFAQGLGYGCRVLEEELNLIEILRQHMVRILRTLSAATFGRIGTHDEAGPMTLAQMLQRVTGHVPHHVKFINEKRQALGLPTIDP